MFNHTKKNGFLSLYQLFIFCGVLIKMMNYKNLPVLSFSALGFSISIAIFVQAINTHIVCLPSQ